MSTLPDRWHSDVLSNTLDMLRYEASLKAQILAMVQELGMSLTLAVLGSGLDTPRTAWQRSRLASLIEEAQSTISKTYGEIADYHASNLAEAVGLSADSLTVRFNASIGVEVLQRVQWTREQLRSLVDGSLVEGAPSADWWARQSVDLQNAFADQMRQGILRGETITQLRDRIMSAGATPTDAIGKMDLRTVSDREIRGIVWTARRNAEALVRTSALSANNDAHMAVYALNSDIIANLQWVATLDPRTCLRCGWQDGQVWPMGEAHIRPTLHWGCRCTVVPIAKTFEELAKKDKAFAKTFDNIGDDTRASMGGQVSADTTWESWLEGMDKATQREALGPGRFKLFEAGKLSLSDLVDQSGNPLTLKALAAR